MTRVSIHVPGGGCLDIDDGLLEPYRAELAAGPDPQPVRLAYAAAHIAMKDSYGEVGHSPQSPGAPEEIAEFIDWETTAAIRQYLAAHGFGIAEAMDTAQRFSIGWVAAQQLVKRCGALQLPHGFVAGATADHLEDIPDRKALIDGVCYQIDEIGDAGGIPIILPLPWLTRWKCTADEYVAVYRDIIRQSPGPLFVHWLGEMFAPELTGYFPGGSFERVMAIDPERVRGAKLSLLDAELEVRLRRQLLERDQIILTGDDLNFADLIAGQSPQVVRWMDVDGHRVALGDFSHALLGIFDAIAEPAELALRFLSRGRIDRFREIMRPCEELSRIIFEPPMQYYKAGLAFLSWLNGRQDNALLVNGVERCRSPEHLLRVARAAARCGVFSDAKCTVERFKQWQR
jgi:hypothetical protein